MNRAQTIDAEWAQERFPRGVPSPTVRVAMTGPRLASASAVAQPEPIRKMAFAPRDKRLGKNALAALCALARCPGGVTARQVSVLAKNGDLPLVNGTLGNLQAAGYALCMHDGKPSRWRITELGLRKVGV